MILEQYCNNSKARVRWTGVSENPGSFFELDNLPPNVILRDPSHLRTVEIAALWDHWTARQRAGKVGLVFTGSDKRDYREEGGKGKGKGKGKAKADPQGFSETEEEEEDEEEDEDEVVDELGGDSEGDGEEEDEEDEVSDKEGENGEQEEQGQKADKGGEDEEEEEEDGEPKEPKEVKKSDPSSPHSVPLTKDARIAFLRQLSQEPQFQKMVNHLAKELVCFNSV
jgi:hypothetical protein